jgi:hypothetical protein
MLIVKETGIDYREIRVISRLYMNQCVQVQLNQGETKCYNWKRS